jgi:DNA-binding NarL/FixJ family response regulator
MNIDKLKEQLIDEVLKEIKTDLKAKIKADILARFEMESKPKPKMVRKYLRDQEKQTILELAMKGMTYSEIGEKVNRQAGTVRSYLVREGYSPKGGQP